MRPATYADQANRLASKARQMASLILGHIIETRSPYSGELILAVIADKLDAASLPQLITARNFLLEESP